ncbi:MAG: hypothetical protein C4527_17365 [Candidatus Omnitrophota bacterium]|nr:MAG: hypothetical protein C4527_17365 [Candidatus Omnitrophota bacterium]
MKPNATWINDWKIGISPALEATIANELLVFFTNFWNEQGLDNKSKTTRNRYANALHTLGGYLVEKAVSDNGLDKTTDELLFEYTDFDEGPLIYLDNEVWQSEVDMVCRKIHQYLKKKTNK